MRRSVRWALMLAVVVAGLWVASTAWADNDPCSRNIGNVPDQVMGCVTLDGVREHQAAFQAIADANGGIRTSGTPGYDASVDYVVARMQAAGYVVTVQDFEFQTSIELGPSALEQTAPGVASYVQGVDFLVIDQTDPGNVTAAVTPVDLQLGPGNASTSGCEAADFAGFPAGHIALLQRGTCTFQQKAENAAAAGAVGAIMMNQGNTPDRTGLAAVTLSAAYSGGIPVFFTTYDRGVEWAGTPGLVLHMFANVFRGTATTSNVFAETPRGRLDNIVMAGAHLDSVDQGPGINDNGSGSAVLLEVAEAMARVQPLRNKLRFAWWGAEESGLVGSDYYVYNLSDVERSKIALYLNFDMVGSPNYVRFVYDGDGSAFGLAGPDGSAAIEQLFANFYGSRGLASEPTQISFRSDYAAFFDFGIPFGGLFTGAEGVKTAEQAAVYGGTAGVAYDPCYHQACDTMNNVALDVLDLNADATAYAMMTYGMTTRDVNGERAKAPDRPFRRGQGEQRGERFVR